MPWRVAGAVHRSVGLWAGAVLGTAAVLGAALGGGVVLTVAVLGHLAVVGAVLQALLHLLLALVSVQTGSVWSLAANAALAGAMSATARAPPAMNLV